MWKLRTQVYLVLALLLVLIAFLGGYALKGARRGAIDADELFSANFTAMSILSEIESARADELRSEAKFRVTRDPAYRAMARQHRERIMKSLDYLRAAVARDRALAGPVEELASEIRGRAAPDAAGRIEVVRRGLESTRALQIERLRASARDLGRIILLTFFIGICITGWLAMMLYHALLGPLDAIKHAARRIREGELSARVARFRGFRELSELRTEFNAMAAKIEELDRMKGDFLSTVSHELKTPLTALKEGLLLMAEKREALPASAAARTIDVCTQATKRLEMMIQNLLDHAKMESGFYSFDERPKNFVSVLQEAIEGVRPIAERRGLAIELHVRTPSHEAAFSSDGIRHAIENLLVNAIKYGDGSRPITIEVERIESRPVPQLEVRVSNYGKSLLPAELTQVFERFFRARNADGQKGVGLGLSVVKRIIEAHHGSVAAESSGGVTCFSFRMPQRYQTHASRPAVAPGAAPGAALGIVLLAAASLLAGCAAPGRSAERSERLTRRAIELLDPGNKEFNPEKGKAYLEYSLKSSGARSVEIPASVLRELLRSERVATDKRRALETQLEVMKEIDLMDMEKRDTSGS